MGDITPICNIPMEFPRPEFPFELAIYVNAAYATDTKTHCSMNGIVATISGTAVVAKSKLQGIVTVSSTEAEFMGMVEGGKLVKYYWTLLEELGYKQAKLTIIYEDNEATINISNARKPMPQVHHIDICWFAIQEWVEHGQIIFHYVATL